MLVATNPRQHAGSVVGNGHCVAFVQHAAGAPPTKQWRRGRQVRGGDVEPGTVIATFGTSGRYLNRTDGSSHAAIFLEELPGQGLRVLDQWLGRPVGERLIHFRDWGSKADNGNDFYVVMT